MAVHRVTYNLYTVNETAESVRRSLDNYFDINNVSVDYFDYPVEEGQVCIHLPTPRAREPDLGPACSRPA